jgi:Asp-tRNA(Asn)/Glu-tRNA(Gln) amidotransferase B subunit
MNVIQLITSIGLIANSIALIIIARTVANLQRTMVGTPPWALKIMRGQLHEEAFTLATKQTLEELVAATTANTNATAAATDALTHYAASNAELTAKLEEALSNAETLDDSAIQEAIAAIKANNDALTAAAPQVAAAVTANAS